MERIRENYIYKYRLKRIWVRYLLKADVDLQISMSSTADFKQLRSALLWKRNFLWIHFDRQTMQFLAQWDTKGGAVPRAVLQKYCNLLLYLLPTCRTPFHPCNACTRWAKSIRPVFAAVILEQLLPRWSILTNSCMNLCAFQHPSRWSPTNPWNDRMSFLMDPVNL